MGWVQAVDMIQEAHEQIIMGNLPAAAGLDPSKLMHMGAMLPDLAAKLPSGWFSIYVDNYDQQNIFSQDPAARV